MFDWDRESGLMPGRLTLFLVGVLWLCRLVHAAILVVYCAQTDPAGIEGKSMHVTAKGAGSATLTLVGVGARPLSKPVVGALVFHWRVASSPGCGTEGKLGSAHAAGTGVFRG